MAHTPYSLPIHPLGPVSYTHLDVYKRQQQYITQLHITPPLLLCQHQYLQNFIALHYSQNNITSYLSPLFQLQL